MQEIEYPSLLHYFIYPRHHEQNTCVETLHSADEKEFYQQSNVSPLLEV